MRQKRKPKLTAPGIWLSGPISTRTFSTSAGASHTAKRKVVLTCARRTPSREGYAPPKMKSDQLVPNADARYGHLLCARWGAKRRASAVLKRLINSDAVGGTSSAHSTFERQRIPHLSRRLKTTGRPDDVGMATLQAPALWLRHPAEHQTTNPASYF